MVTGLIIAVLAIALVALAIIAVSQSWRLIALQSELDDAVAAGRQGSNFNDVGDFHEKFGLDSVTHQGVAPRDLPYEVYLFRASFMREELSEFQDAVALGNQAKAFDALIDLVYVAMGTAHLMGLPWQMGWSLVQRANLAKARATGADDPRSVRGHALDVVKPEGWQAPDVEGLLFQLGWPTTQV